MWTTARTLLKVIRETKPNLIHVHSPVLNVLPAILVGWLTGLPVVYEVRALWEDAAVDLGQSRRGGLRYIITRYLETFALRRADGVVTICEGLRNEIEKREVRKNRIVVVGNAVEAASFAQSAAEPVRELAQKLGLSGNFVVGFIGSFYHYEGLDLFLSAVAQIRKALPNLRVLLVGGGPEDAKLRALVEHAQLGDVVTFTGRIPHEDVPHYYGLLNLFICPRRRMRLTELVTPLKPLEAMAMGVPVLVSDVGGHRELVSQGRTGFLFQADNADSMVEQIVNLAFQPGVLAEVADAARLFVLTQRTWEACAGNYRRLYDGLASLPAAS
jgi:PEP-CTERM/exosortase A-associated glycosyltransferase